MAAASCVQEEKEEKETQEPTDAIAQGRDRRARVHPGPLWGLHTQADTLLPVAHVTHGTLYTPLMTRPCPTTDLGLFYGLILQTLSKSLWRWEIYWPLVTKKVHVTASQRPPDSALNTSGVLWPLTSELPRVHIWGPLWLQGEDRRACVLKRGSHWWRTPKRRLRKTLLLLEKTRALWTQERVDF